MPLIIAPDFYMLDGSEWWEDGPRFFLTCSDRDELLQAAQALDAAASRFFLTTEEGEELPDFETLEFMVDPPYTPNFLSDIYAMGDGIYLWGDTKGVLDARMASTMLAILGQELDRRGVTAFLSNPPRDFRSDDVTLIAR